MTTKVITDECSRTNGFRLLEQFGPEVLSALHKEFPSAAGRFTGSGQLLGPTVKREDVAAARAISRFALQLCSQGIERNHKQLRTANRVTLLSCILTALSGSALLGTTLSAWPHALSLTVGGLALLGALAGIVGRRLRIGFGGKKLTEGSDNFARLSERLFKVYLGLEICMTAKIDSEWQPNAAKLVDQAHNLSGDVYSVAVALGWKGLAANDIREIIEAVHRDAFNAEKNLARPGEFDLVEMPTKQMQLNGDKQPGSQPLGDSVAAMARTPRLEVEPRRSPENSSHSNVRFLPND